MNSKFFTVRGSLVSRIAAAGLGYQLTVNIYDRNTAAWLVDATPETAEIFKQFYAEIGRPLPPTVQRWIAHNEGAGDADA